LPVELFRSFEAQTGLRILEGYGLTEGTCVSSLNPLDGESRIGSIGLRLPWQPMRAMILDAQGQFQRAAGVDEVGSICISGPNVFPGYLNPDHNQGNWFETVQADGSSRRWFNTGDLGRMDSEGYFWLTGRKKELIIRGGHNIDPKLIEEALAAHPAVAMCAAVGRPDAHAGELPVAYVQLQPGAQVSEEELLAFAGARIHEAAARPKAILIVDALPLTAVGKIFKPSLSLREIAAVVRAEAASAGLVLSQLVVEQDAKRGLLASYQIAPAQTDAATAFRQALGRYAFHSQELSES
jgi:fatty-acyl-CoA synthase/long-chain acyl-CoA synthetase